MKDPPGAPPSDTKQNLSKLLQRINETRRTVEGTVTSTRDKRTKMTKISEAKAKLATVEKVFDKYDADGDSMLSKKEVQAFSKGEYSFTLPLDALDLIFTVLSKDGKNGIAKPDFHYLKVSIGIAREKVKDTERREKREAHEKKLQEAQTALQAKVTEASKIMTTAEEVSGKIDASLKLEAGAEEKSAVLNEKADAASKLVQEAREGSESVKTQIGDFGIDSVDKELELWIKSQAHILNNRVAKLDAVLTGFTNRVAKLKEDAQKIELAELGNLKKAVLSAIRYHQQAKKLTVEAVFEEMSGDKDGRIDEAKFVKFFETCEKASPAKEKAADGEQADAGKAPPVASAGELARVFEFFDEEEERCITKGQFLKLARAYNKVTKDTVLTDVMNIKEGKPLRRLEVGEVLAVLEGPLREEDAEVMRVRCKAMSDSVEGWCTVAGSHGTTYLADGGYHFKVVKETILTECFEVGAVKDPSKKMPTRKLKEGEIIEVREWPVKQETTGLVRMQCRAMLDGRVGWATTVGNTGTVYIESAY